MTMGAGHVVLLVLVAVVTGAPLAEDGSTNQEAAVALTGDSHALSVGQYDT